MLIWLLSTIIYLILTSGVFITANKFVPSINTSKLAITTSDVLDSEIYRQITKRTGEYPYNTTVVPLSNLVWYLVVNFMGVVYVNVCNLKFESGNILHSNNSSTKDFLLTVFLVTPLLYFTSMLFVFKSSSDLDF
jgi:beta-lactamase regulating signal transducer with metallopeptidase domain